MNLKANLRQSVRAQLKVAAQTVAQIPSEKKALAQANQLINERLIGLFESQFKFNPEQPHASRAFWSAFQAHGLEPDLQPALIEIRNRCNIDWVFPKTEAPNATAGEMEFYLPQNEEAFLANRWGLLEPSASNSRKIDGAQIAGFLIPGVAFDGQGTRLGRGKGYFDKYLSRPDYSQKTKIGIAFDRQLLNEELPKESHDVAMDIVLSEHRCFAASRLGLKAKLGGAIPCDEFESSSQINSSERTTT